MSDLAELRHIEINEFKRSLSGEQFDKNAVIWKDVETEIKSVDMERRQVTIAYSSNVIDRDGDVITQKGIDLRNYRKNPVVLFGHGGSSFAPAESRLPIGRSMKLFRETDGDLERSFSVDRFTERDLNPLGDTVFRMLTSKPAFLNAASIGFRPINLERREQNEDEPGAFYNPTNFKMVEKLEHSIVPVPSNPDALSAAKSSGIDIDPIGKWAEEMLDLELKIKCGGMSRENLEKCWNVCNRSSASISIPELPKEISGEAEIEEKSEQEEKQDEESLPQGVTDRPQDGFIVTPNFVGSPRNKYGTHASKGFKGSYKRAWELHFSQVNGGRLTPTASGPIRGTVRRVAMISAAMKPACSVVDAEGISARGGAKSPLSGSYPEKPSDYGLSAWASPSDDDLTLEDIRFTCSDLNVVKRAAVAEIKRRIADRESDEAGYDYDEVKSMLAEALAGKGEIDLSSGCCPEIELMSHNIVSIDAEELLAWIEERKDLSEFSSDVKQFVIQTLIFPKKHWDNLASVKKWAQDNDFRTDKVDETTNTWRLRQRSPDQINVRATICINPGRDAPKNKCRVFASGGPERKDEEVTTSDVDQSTVIVTLEDKDGETVDISDGDETNVGTDGKSTEHESETFEFPSVRADDDARKDDLENQISELRENVRAIIISMQKLVESIRISGEPIDSNREGSSVGKESDDDVIMLVDDEPETKEEAPSGEVGRFICEEMAKAVTSAFDRARGRLPN